MIYGLLLLLISVAPHAASMVIDLNPNISIISSNRIISHCFTPDSHPDMGETNLRDCRDTLVAIAHTPDFTTPIRFSKNPRSGASLPRSWRSGECLIFVSCENNRDSYTFRFADVLQLAKNLVDTCVGTIETEKWGILRWGGVEVLGDSRTFYVSVGKPRPRSASGGNVIPANIVNGTILDPAIEVS